MEIICFLLWLYLLALFARIVLSWFPGSPYGPSAQIRNVLSRITDPVLTPLRRVLPPVRIGAVGLDLSPLIVTLVLTAIVMPIVCR